MSFGLESNGDRLLGSAAPEKSYKSVVPLTPAAGAAVMNRMWPPLSATAADKMPGRSMRTPSCCTIHHSIIMRCSGNHLRSAVGLHLHEIRCHRVGTERTVVRLNGREWRQLRQLVQWSGSGRSNELVLHDRLS